VNVGSTGRACRLSLNWMAWRSNSRRSREGSATVASSITGGVTCASACWRFLIKALSPLRGCLSHVFVIERPPCDPPVGPTDRSDRDSSWSTHAYAIWRTLARTKPCDKRSNAGCSNCWWLLPRGLRPRPLYVCTGLHVDAQQHCDVKPVGIYTLAFDPYAATKACAAGKIPGFAVVVARMMSSSSY
jgi:hypothetical protein